MTDRVVAIVQARMGSARLPGKVLKKVLQKPLLEYLIERVKEAHLVDELVVATSELHADNLIYDYCSRRGVKCYRGSEEDVLLRYLEAAKLNRADYVVRICADSPLIDPIIIDEVVEEFLLAYPRYDYFSNTIDQTYPLGMNIEIFSYGALEKAHLGAKLPYEREHVTPYIYLHRNCFSVGHKQLEVDLSHMRLTVDFPEDFELVKFILEELYPANPSFKLSDIVELCIRKPEMFGVNAHRKQKKVNFG